MWKYLNRGISTPIAIGIILILSVLLGGFTWWQHAEIQKEEKDQILIKECDIDFDCQDKALKESCLIGKISKKCVNNICRLNCNMAEGDAYEIIDDETADWENSTKIIFEGARGDFIKPPPIEEQCKTILENYINIDTFSNTEFSKCKLIESKINEKCEALGGCYICKLECK